MRTLTFLLTLLMATALQAQPLLDEASSTLQPALQQLGRRLLRHKTGSIVAIQPATGRVLCLVTHSTEGEKPALALATPYPPGSTMKTAEALMLYSEGIIDDETTVACQGALRTGNIRVRCHSHASPLRLTNALAYSCNTWFLSTFLRMMGDRDRYETKDSAITVWNRYMRSMGLGRPTGIDMEGEKGGLLANAHYLNRRYDGRYITGFGYVDLDDENLCFGTYWIDTKTTDAVDKVSEAAPATKVVGSYGVDGKAKRIAAPKGLRLDKFANGKVKKVVVK